MILNFISCYHFEDMCCTLPYRDSTIFQSLLADENYFYIYKHQRILSAVRSHSITRQEQSEDHKILTAGSPFQTSGLDHSASYRLTTMKNVTVQWGTTSGPCLCFTTHALQQSYC
jgi:hypothetical protein